MQISYFEDEKKVVVKIVGELDESASNVAKQELDYILNSTNKKALVFDMARMSFMDSTGIGVLIGRYKIAKKLGIALYVKNLSKTVDKLFYMSGLYEIMTKLENDNEI
ncbi:MAG: STAS domain-containing protein [Clostridia bacterium]|nr:STAS domain-containing protein [Clostridia bacterium]